MLKFYQAVWLKMSRDQMFLERKFFKNRVLIFSTNLLQILVELQHWVIASYLSTRHHGCGFLPHLYSFPASAGIEQIKKTEEERIGVIRIQTQDFFVMNLQLDMFTPKPAPLPLSLNDF